MYVYFCVRARAREHMCMYACVLYIVCYVGVYKRYSSIERYLINLGIM